MIGRRQGARKPARPRCVQTTPVGAERATRVQTWHAGALGRSGVETARLKEGERVRGRQGRNRPWRPRRGISGLAYLDAWRNRSVISTHCDSVSSDGAGATSSPPSAAAIPSWCSKNCDSRPASKVNQLFASSP
jgi:hypothetical protein